MSKSAEHMRRYRSGNAGQSKGGLISKITDNTNFNAWLKENMSNPEFKQFGRENGMEAVRQLWREKRIESELSSVHEISQLEAVEQLRAAIPQSYIQAWFVEANSDVKPKLVESILSNKGTLNAGLNIAYTNYLDEMALTHQNSMPFNKWLRTPQTLYRGEYGQGRVQSDIFASYTRDRKVAESFGQKVSTVRIRPIDTWGSYQTTGEQEYLIPVKRERKKK